MYTRVMPIYLSIYLSVCVICHRKHIGSRDLRLMPAKEAVGEQINSIPNAISE